MEYGFWSVLPPVIAIVLAIATRRVVPSLLIGVISGVVVLRVERVLNDPDHAGFGEVFRVVSETCETHLWASLSDGDHLRVFVFTLLMGAMIGVIHRSGGMHGVVEALAPLARTRSGGQILTWVLGLVIFIDDYANTLLLGNTMRPLADRLKISREKLAYLVDSTAAPVSGLALVSTWVAGEIGYIEDGYKNVAGLTQSIDGMAIFIATIPSRFYVLWALVMVVIVALSRRDFGPMLAAERRALEGSVPEIHPAGIDEASLSGADVPRRWINAVVPIVVTVAATVGLLVLTGRAEVDPSAGLIQVIGNGNSYVALLYGSLSGLAVATVMALSQRILSLSQLQKAAFDGACLVLPALTILWLAWALSGITGSQYLGTGDYLGSLLEQSVDVRWTPTLVFIISSFVAFATGTSWGTMGILMPIVVSATFRMLASQSDAVSPVDPLLIASIGSVLAGAIFGDHCSPISDTTVLSSQASGCDHVAHVRTQLPYALYVGVVSIVCGTIPVAFGVSVWLLLPLGTVVLVAGVYAFGREA